MIKLNNKKRIVLLIFVITFALTLLSYNYGDILVTARHGINLWNILFDGKILQFYDYNIIASGNNIYTQVYACYYNIVTYIIFAIWNVPLSLLLKFTSIDVMNNILCLLYIKLLPVFFLLLSTGALNKIMKELGIKDKFRKICIFIFLSSAITLTCVLVIGQYDIISVYFQLLGLFAYIKNDDKRFVLWSAIAFCCKYFSILIFLPLLIHKYKNIWKIIAMTALMLIPFVITNILFRVSDIGLANGFDPNLSTQIIARLFKETTITYPLFVIVYIILIVWCYVNKKEDYKYSFIYICLIAMSSFFGLLNGYPYWCIMIAPYLALFISISPELFELNIILEIFGSIALMFGKIVRYTGCFSTKMLKPMIWNYVFPEKLVNESILDIFINRVHEFPQWDIIPRLIFATAIGCMIYYTYKQNTKRTKLNNNEIDTCMIIRIIMICIFVLSPLFSIIFRFVN